MSILIKGLDMPEKDRALFINIYSDGKVTYQLDLKCRVIAQAEEVPAPHGDLIDRNKIQCLGNTAYGNVFSAPTVRKAEK